VKNLKSHQPLHINTTSTNSRNTDKKVNFQPELAESRKYSDFAGELKDQLWSGREKSFPQIIQIRVHPSSYSVATLPDASRA
jgi:hypothetical protein